MDGLPQNVVLPRFGQRTLKSAIECVGVGLHSGRKVRLALLPADPDTGIVFRRSDLPGSPGIPARFDCVSETRLCTMLASPEEPSVRIGTVEHVMAALAGAGIDNAVVTVDGPETPILDGSAAGFLFLIECAGIVEQDAPCAEIELRRPVRVQEGAAFAELRPGPVGLDMMVSIAFAAPAIGRQALRLRLAPGVFGSELARARTFVLAQDVDQLRASGLGRGGTLENAIVVDGDHVLNPGGLRTPDEFVRHKMLDAVGDLALAGAPLRGRFNGHCSGHTLNNRLLHALFADAANWRRLERPAAEPFMVPPTATRSEQRRAA
jgi:UDP-3-O-[3-hydroxymyristoyl] N-acetylglucosamine deacetylase